MTKVVTLESLQNSIDDIASAIKELAQFTCNGFSELGYRADRHDKQIDKLGGRMDRLEKHAESVNAILRDHTMRFVQMQTTLDEILGEQAAQRSDIKEIFAILAKHEKTQKLSIAERKDAEIRLNRVIEWAKEASKALDIPIKI
ncbi:MAG: hypothetical protein WCP03_03565 [Candidatus Saccharibacteria bacterium]